MRFGPLNRMVGGMSGLPEAIGTTNLLGSPTWSRFRGGRITQGHVEVDFQSCRLGGEVMNRKYAVIFEPAASNWAAYVPDLPGCVTRGQTSEETERNLREAIHGHIETLLQFGEPV